MCLLVLEITFFSSHDVVEGSIHERHDSISIIIPQEKSSIKKINENIRKLNSDILPNINSNKNINLHKFYDPLYDSKRDWFNSTKFHSNSQVNFSCPVYENICVYNQHFYVHNKSDEFDLKFRMHSDLLGVNMPNLHQSIPIYKQFFHATIWNDNSEYINANCYYNSIYNHLILEANYQTMLGEFYARTLRFLHYLNNIQNLITNDIQLWLLIGDQKSLYVSHYLFTERFSIYNLQHFTSMFDHIPCQCYHRILFCGFKKDGHEIAWPRKDRKGKKHNGKDILNINNNSIEKKDNNNNNNIKKDNKTYLMPLKTLISRMEPEEARNIFPEMIIKYNEWIDEMDINLNNDINKWKYNEIINYFNKKNIKFNISISEINEWKFIGLYDRKVRRSWLKIEKHRNKCNEKYNKYKIFCHIIVLENFLHSRDVIIIHRASFMLIGVHGAQLTDSIWMKYNNIAGIEENKYIIELLPYGGPKYTSSIIKPTALGVIFWGSQYNHVGMKLLNTSMQFPNRKWDENDFYVSWQRLNMVIDFLIIDSGGICKKFGRADKINVTKNIKNLGFAIYNAYCVENPIVWHGVKPPRLY
eukprot:516916_1